MHGSLKSQINKELHTVRNQSEGSKSKKYIEKRKRLYEILFHMELEGLNGMKLVAEDRSIGISRKIIQIPMVLSTW